MQTDDFHTFLKKKLIHAVLPVDGVVVDEGAHCRELGPMDAVAAAVEAAAAAVAAAADCDRPLAVQIFHAVGSAVDAAVAALAVNKTNPFFF